MYTYALLDPRRSPEAHAHNDEILGDGATVLGIEVTVPELAARCGLGNIDPQHLGGDAATAAIDAAWTHPLPPNGTTLVTVRADADALGAMAILEYRAGSPGGGGWNDEYDVGARAAQISAVDRESMRPWPGVRELPGPQELMGGPAASVAAVAMDPRRSIAERVGLVTDWLVTGQFAGSEDLQRELHTEGRAVIRQTDVDVDSGVAVVTTGRQGVRLGYYRAGVVVATNPTFRFAGGEPHRKHTVARWNSTVLMDWDGLLSALREREPGWGGSSSIIGSPQGVPSVLDTKELAALVVAYTPSGNTMGPLPGCLSGSDPTRR